MKKTAFSLPACQRNRFLSYVNLDLYPVSGSNPSDRMTEVREQVYTCLV